MNEEELRVITEAIWKRYGIDFRCYETRSLSRRVSRVMDKFGFESAYQLWENFLFDQSFIDTFIDEVTVGLTELFRNPKIWKFLGDEKLRKIPQGQETNIWHAGCSTGEEVYTMLITLMEYHRFDQTNVWASDISNEALRIAKEGVYDNSLWQKYNCNYKEFTSGRQELDIYAQINGADFKMKDFLKEHLKFEPHNLVRDAVNVSYDLIFCRNVLIYFDEELKMKVLAKFQEALKPGGLLILGYFDYLSSPQEFFTLKYPEYKIYMRSN